MGAPTRVRLEFRLNIHSSGGRRKPALPDAVRYRIEKELKRRAEALGLRVYYLRTDLARITLDVLLQPHMVKSNIERALWGAINGILKKESPHLVKGRHTSNRPSGFEY